MDPANTIAIFVGLLAGVSYALGVFMGRLTK